ncbi:MAG: hypothetical protein ABSE07_10630 [Methanoregula sp.]
MLLIPDKEPFAGTVRQCNVDSDTAHWMALAAMEQYGCFIVSHWHFHNNSMAISQATTVFSLTGTSY